MTKKRSAVQKIARGIGIAVGIVIVLALVVPFLVPVSELSDLVPAEDLAGAAGRFATVPFPGTDGIEIHYVDRVSDRNATGSREASPDRTFVLLHGSMFTLTTWDDIAGSLSAYGRVVAYDQVPYGLSEKVQAGEWEGENPYSQTAAVRRLIAFLDELGLERVTLVGHSYGGTLATRAAIEFPDRVEALVLVAPAIYVSESMPAWLLRTPQIRRLGPLLARSLATSKSFFEMCYADSEAWTQEKAARTTVHTRVEGWDSALWAYLQAWNSSTANLESRLPEIVVPTLVVAGSEDAVVSVEDSRRVAERIPNTTFVEFLGSGHMPHEEVPEVMVDTIARWIDGR